MKLAPSVLMRGHTLSLIVGTTFMENAYFLGYKTKIHVLTVTRNLNLKMSGDGVRDVKKF